MAAPATIDEFLDLVRKSGVADDKRLEAYVQRLRSSAALPTEPSKLAGLLVRDGYLTHFQAEHLMQGKWRRFSIGKYKVLERLGSGGMGQVFLCEHKLMRRRVAVKVLPAAKAKDDSARDRFYREARAVAALDHPNIVHAYDIDQDEDLHFLVMEYVDGSSLQDIVKKSGPLDVSRAAHYIRQAALGLEHAHQAKIVHRDIKPGNILVDRSGVVKILDMGLARFFNDEEDILTKKYDENVLGTADYLAPEQALDSHEVDIRADIYSLGATFYFLLTGKPPFGEGTVAQKLIWHQTRKPKPLSEFRQDVPPALEAVLNKMMAKDRAQRYAMPGEVADALAPFTQVAIAPPSETEMPHLSPAATGQAPGDTAAPTTVTRTPTSPVPVKSIPISPPVSRPGSSSAGRVATPKPSSGIGSAPGARGGAVAAPPTPPPVPAAPAPTAPAAAAPARGVAPAPAPQEDDSVPWFQYAADTPGPSAQTATSPAAVSSSRHLLTAEERAKRKERRRLWTVVGILSILLLAVVGFLVVKYVLPHAASNAPVARGPLIVSKKGVSGKAYATIRQALSSAQSGDVIELHDALHEETLVVEKAGLMISEVTVRAAQGLEVVWKPSMKDEKKPLLTLQNAPGFKLKGKSITLSGMIDGKRRLQDVVLLSSSVPGVTLEDLTISGFEQTGVKIMNAAGEEGRPARLLALDFRVEPKSKVLAGIYLDAVPNRKQAVNDWIEIRDPLMQGAPAALAVQVKNKAVNGPNVVGIP